MELKRYVMLDSKTILDELNNDYIMTLDKKIVRWFGVIESVELFMKRVLKTSDNILALVEVGDLIETARDGVVEIIGENFYVRTGVNIYLIDIKAIYKRQSNGDYKKYEVKA